MKMVSEREEHKLQYMHVITEGVHSFCSGEPVFDESGELVCTSPFPSMPTCFWNDEDGIKYKKAYFSHYQGHSILSWF